MPAGFDTAFARVKELVADFRANEKFHLSGQYQEQEPAHEMHNDFQPLAFSLQPCLSDALGDVLYALTPAEIQIVEKVTV